MYVIFFIFFIIKIINHLIYMYKIRICFKKPTLDTIIPLMMQVIFFIFSLLNWEQFWLYKHISTKIQLALQKSKLKEHCFIISSMFDTSKLLMALSMQVSSCNKKHYFLIQYFTIFTIYNILYSSPASMPISSQCLRSCNCNN